MNNGTYQNNDSGSFDNEAYRMNLQKKQEKRRIISTLASCCILILASYLVASRFSYFVHIVALVLSEVFSLFEYNDEVISTVSGILTYCAQFLIPGVVFLLLRRRRYRDCIFVSSVEKDKKMRIPEIICFAFSAFAVSTILSVVSAVFTSIIGLDGSVYDIESATTPAGFIIELLSVAILPAILEEFFFRGIILSELIPFGKGFTIIASALFFATAHGSIEQIIFSFSYGIIFAYIALSSGSILPCIIIHFCNNAYATVFGYLENVLPLKHFELLSSISYFILVGIGLVCTAIILGKNKIRLQEKNTSTLTKGEILKTLVSPIMLIYYLIIFVETIGTYLFWG